MSRRLRACALASCLPLVAHADPPHDGRANAGEAARALAHFLRSPETQRWIGELNRSSDSAQLFYPIGE